MSESTKKTQAIDNAPIEKDANVVVENESKQQENIVVKPKRKSDIMRSYEKKYRWKDLGLSDEENEVEYDPTTNVITHVTTEQVKKKMGKNN